jgi:hypothetical protein
MYRPRTHIKASMRRCVALPVAVLALALAPTTAGATSRDIASTHAYLTASYALLHTAVAVA